MTFNRAAEIIRNQKRWDTMVVHPNRIPELDKTAARLFSSKDRYVEVESRLTALGYYCPWWFTAITSEREYGGPPHWDRQLSQGDPLSRVSWNVPAGRGPFHGPDAWLRGCLDALIDCAPHTARDNHDWTPGGVATAFGDFNGEGYAMRGLPSPYEWSGSDQYVKGKFTRDHYFDPNVVDVQEGCMPLLSRLMKLDPTITFGGTK
jgi:lysozyme family protein